MIAAHKHRVTVQPGGVIEIRSPDLKVGAEADVIILIDSAVGQHRPLTAFRGAAQGLFASPEDVDAFIRNERDAWDR